MANVTPKKLPYKAPTLAVLGTLAEITQAHGAIHHLDATFPAGTPFGNLTFS